MGCGTDLYSCPLCYLFECEALRLFLWGSHLPHTHHSARAARHHQLGVGADGAEYLAPLRQALIDGHCLKKETDQDARSAGLFWATVKRTSTQGLAWCFHLPWCLAMALLVTAFNPLCGRLICRWCANLWQRICWGWGGGVRGQCGAIFSQRTMTHRTISLLNNWFLWVYGAFRRWAKVIPNYCPSNYWGNYGCKQVWHCDRWALWWFPGDCFCWAICWGLI